MVSCKCKEGKLRVWHNSKFGEKAFTVPVANIAEGKRILRILADYDLYLGEEKVSCNAQGIDQYHTIATRKHRDGRV